MTMCGPAADAVSGLSDFTPTGKASRSRRRRTPLFGAALLATTALVPAMLARSAVAQTVTWDGSASGDWDTATNWDTNAVPTAADDVVIDDISISTPFIGPGVNAQAKGLTVGDTTFPGALLIGGGGTLTTTGVSSFGVAPGAGGAITMGGAGSQWNSGSAIKLGVGGVAGLTVASGAQVVNTSSGELGILAGSAGYVTVMGTNSLWSNAGNMSVGGAGFGGLTIIDQGQVSNHEGYVGAGAGAGGAGQVKISGAGSTWTNNQELKVGFLGDGTLEIIGGGTVISGNESAVGDQAGSSGTVTISGTGSNWTTTGIVTIGGHGAGDLTVENDGQFINSGVVDIGQSSGTGMVTVTGPGSLLTTTGQLSVGDLGTGTLMVANGGKIQSNLGFVGLFGGAQGAATITGMGSSWTATGLVGIGESGTGSLTIADSGQFIGGSAINVGSTATGIGDLTVTGAGSLLTAAAQLTAGVFGTGTVTVSDGGKIQSNFGYVGLFGGTGFATITGAGSTWTTGTFIVGADGQGTLTIADRGLLDVAGSSTIGSFAGVQGTATVTGAGSTWTSSGPIAVGESGNGDLTIVDGGNVTNVDAHIAALPGSTGEVSVIGAGSDWTSSGSLFVGAAGTGALTIADSATVGANFSSIGADFNSSGMATVTGAGSTWNTALTLEIGGFGHGEMAVGDQATVNVAGDAFLGDFAAGTGSASVTGAGSLFSVGGVLVVGRQGDGTLAVLNGGKATSADGVIGQAGFGEATVSGAGSLWEITDDYFAIGESGTGTLTIADGGLVNMADNLGFTVIGASASGVGNVSVVDAGWINGGVLVVGNAGSGVLTLDNATLVNSGGVVGGGPGSSGTVTVANGSTWTTNGLLYVGSAGTGEVTIASGGIVGAGIVGIANVAGSQGTLNIGAAAGDAPAAPGTLATTDLTFGAGVGTLVFNHTSQNYLFSPEIDGVGAIDAIAGRTLLATAGTYTGSTTIHGGATLSVDGSIGGTLDVLSGGRLEGAGTAGFVTVAGTVAPGNSIGTFHVAGDYTQMAGSTYEVEIDAAGNSDLIDVAGMVTLTGGTVEIVPFPDFALATPYTILTAAGGVTGTFDGISMAFSSLFLLPQLSYDANNAFFTIAQNASFDSVALTPNQKAAASGADSLGPGNTVWDSIALLGTQEEAQAAFDAISGEVHASAGSVLIEDSRFVRKAMNARLRTSFVTVGASAMPVLAYGRDGPAIAPADTSRFAAWGHAFGSWGEWDSDGNAASLSRDTGGFVLGGDMAAGEAWRLGLLAGYSSSSFDIDDRASSASAESYHLGAYAGTELGKWGLRFGAGYSWHDVETNRMAAFSGFSDTLTAGYDAATAQFFGEVGYRIDTAHSSFEPFANLAYVNLHTDGFTETGGAAALTAASSSHDTTFTTLGLRAETALPLGERTVRLRGMLGWRHAFGDAAQTTDLTFAAGSAFTIAGVPIAEDAAVIEVGLDFALSPSANLGIAYNGQIGSGVSDHGLKARFEVKF